jgi:hypothetical protein
MLPLFYRLIIAGKEKTHDFWPWVLVEIFTSSATSSSGDVIYDDYQQAYLLHDVIHRR